MPIQSIIGDDASFFDSIFANIHRARIDVRNFEMDHLCYRVSTLELYQQKKSQLLHHGKILTEAAVSGRPIATFDLDQPLIYQDRKISLLELPAPKPGKKCLDGLEHAEFVVGTEMAQLQARYPQLFWETSGLMKKANPELELKFPDGTAIKFHAESLREVIRKELLASGA